MYEILDTSSEKWDMLLSCMPFEMQDIYYKSHYYKMYEANGDGVAKCFAFESDGDIGLYPFLLNRIDGYDTGKVCYDIQTAYGYGGPILSSGNAVFRNEFEKQFMNYCKDQNIIAEFIRFHPLICNHEVFRKNIEVIRNRTTVYLDVSKSIDNIWHFDVSSKNRNMIRKAEKNGLKVYLSDDYTEFKKIYEKTMDKVNASDYYYFDDDYYNNMKDNKEYILLNVAYDNVIIAAAIFIKCGYYFHYHLAGSRSEFLNMAPNNLLLWEAIKIAVASDAKTFHFGGGLTDNADDGLYKFKSNFSKSTAGFYIGKRIHDVHLYKYLINEWEGRNGKSANILLQYRL